MENVENKLREEARKLLIEKKVDLIIGYEQGTLPLIMTPCFITSPEEVERLVFNPLCVQNLAKFLPDIIYQHRDSQKRLKAEEKTKKVVGIVARGCTSRSLVIQLQERQYGRDEVVILGVPCRGYADRRKVSAFLEGQEIIRGELIEDKILVKIAESDREVPLSEVIADNCLTCRFNNPVIHDTMSGEMAPPMDADAEYRQVEDFSRLSEEDRWDYFVKEMNKCIRCYACRNACPSCYCRSCFVEQTQPQWIGLGIDPSDNQVFQIMRLYHMAGRCVDCGSCTAVCPMDVDLRTYLKKLDSDGWNLFGHRAGASFEEPALLSAFKESDGQDFIFEPE
ncbi:MAG TPA: 4Fe-4S dicluster domain-containing protein [Syntrophales bacterium]|nr:4Fe-4S dicluster domain-containing protein [Syntrophales bacterium]